MPSNKSTNIAATTRSYGTAVVAALFIFSIAVIGLWLSGVLVSVNGNPSAVPMELGIALTIALLSLACLAERITRWASAGIAAACAALVISSSAILCYALRTIFGTNITQIDALLLNAAMPAAPSAWLAVTLLSFAVLVLLKQPASKFILAASCSALIASLLSFTSLVSSAIGVKSIYGWSEILEAAPLSALSIAALSIVTLQSADRILASNVHMHRVWKTLRTYIVGGGISLALWLAADYSESARMVETLKRSAKARTTILQNAVDINIEELRSVERFFASSTEVSEEEFDTFTKLFLSGDSSISAISWAPRVPDAERAKLETGLRRKHGVYFKAIDGKRKLIPHTGATVYFPTVYIEPSYADRALGFDPYSDSLQTKVFDDAARAGEARSSEPFTLFGEDASPAQKEDFIIAVPVFMSSSSFPPIESARDERVSGFVIGTFRLSQLITSALRGFPSSGPEFRLFATSGAQSQPLYTYEPPEDMESGNLETRAPSAQAQENLTIAGRKYTLAFTPTTASLSHQGTGFAPSILLMSLAVTLLSAIYLNLLRRKQEELREREEWFHQLAFAAPLGIFRTDAQGRYEYVNPAWTKLTGLETADAKGDGWVKAIHPSDRNVTFNSWNEATRNAHDFQMDFRMQLASGAVRWISSAATPVFDRDKKMIGYVGTSFDITEHVQTQEVLIDETERQAALLETLAGNKETRH